MARRNSHFAMSTYMSELEPKDYYITKVHGRFAVMRRLHDPNATVKATEFASVSEDEVLKWKHPARVFASIVRRKEREHDRASR